MAHLPPQPGAAMCKQALRPVIKKVCKKGRREPGSMHSYSRPGGGRGGMCLSDLKSYAQGYDDLRLSRIFIFDVSISLFSSF